eukprot:Gb_12200 [translate_table: standard]
MTYKLRDYNNDNLVYGFEYALRILIIVGEMDVGTHQSDNERFRVMDATPFEIKDFLVRVKERELRKKVWNITITSHQMGSCRMGIYPKALVVDDKGES